MTHPLLKVTDLHAGYGRAEVLHGINLEAGPGQRRHRDRPQRRRQDPPLLNALMGVLPAQGRWPSTARTSACLTLEERVMLGMALVPEKRELFGTMPVEDNLVLGGYRADALGNKPLARCAGAGLRAVPAPEGAPHPAGRHAVGRRAPDAGGGPRADVRPKLLMLDEPSLGLAPLVVREIFRIIDALR
jgi:branched-chain amino acid transport system ATP-binding protein